MGEKMHIVNDMLAALLVFLGGALATAWASLPQQRTSFEEAVLGPLGALALAMLVIYGLTKYLSIERREARDANEARIKQLNEQIERQASEIARLWQEVHGKH